MKFFTFTNADLPIWQKIIDNGEHTLGVTDMRMTRFWITLDQGVDLVFKAIRESRLQMHGTAVPDP